MELSTKRKGFITEEKIKLWFFERGWSVSVPLGDDDRYDFIVDFNGKLLRMQSKTANLKRTKGCLNICTSSCHSNNTSNYRKQYSKDEIDFFCTLNPETGKIYLIPVEECGNEFNLRLIPSKNNNIKNVHFAENYEGEKMIERILNN